MPHTTRPRTTYATFLEAQADGWRRVNHATDRDISGLCSAYRSPDGQISTAVLLTAERSGLFGLCCCVQMFRTTPER
jgi:hypothetical protein